MQISGHDIGVCSWSLRAADMAELLGLLRQLRVQHVQLAVAPLLAMEDERRQRELQSLAGSGLTVTAGMINFPGEDYSSIAVIRQTGGFVPDRDWPQRRDLTIRAAALCASIGVKLLSTHVGFIPPAHNEAYGKILGRVREIASALARNDVTLLMETGQERAAELLRFLNDANCRNVEVNFDPANMILYGVGDPIEAIATLNRHIRHVHAKDAILSDQPLITWGREVPLGQGQVDLPAFLAALRKAGYTGPLVIERESGTQRLADAQGGIEALAAAAAKAATL